MPLLQNKRVVMSKFKKVEVSDGFITGYNLVTKKFAANIATIELHEEQNATSKFA
jgi:hypothetical protein